MKFHLLTIFPDILDSYISKGMLRVAQERKIISIKPHFLREYAVDKRGTVDDRPFGGGPGQVFMIEPIVKALSKIPGALKHESMKTLKHKNIKSLKQRTTKVVLLSAKGKTWNQQLAQKYSKLDEIVFICPRYEGVDERVKKFVDDEISIGDYVLTGGELGAAVIMDSVTRLLPGVLGEPASLLEESHSTPGYKEYPQYTRPEVFEYKKKKYRVPKVLLSGHHGKVKEWREKQSKPKNS